MGVTLEITSQVHLDMLTTLFCLVPLLLVCSIMLDICNSYANQHQILFNASKSCSVIFGSKDCKHVPTHSSCVFKLNGQQIPMQDKAKHLGHTIIGKVSGDTDIACIIKSFNRSVNILLEEIGAVPYTILCRLFQSYCTSLYGIVLCTCT